MRFKVRQIFIASNRRYEKRSRSPGAPRKEGQSGEAAMAVPTVNLKNRFKDNPLLSAPMVGFFLILMQACSLMGQVTLKVEVGLVTVGVRITDKKARPVTGLTAKDFTLLENDQPYPISFFSSEEMPISLVILLDHSTSMKLGAKLSRAKEAALSLVRSSHPETEFLFIPFDHEISPVSEFVNDRMKIERQIQEVEVGGGTSLYDAILVGLTRCAKASNARQTVVVITDGSDEDSVHKLEDVIQGIRESQVQFHAIGYFDPREDEIFETAGEKVVLLSGNVLDSPGLVVQDNPRYVLQRLARESGAEAYFPKSDDDLRHAVEKISRDLREQYTLAFYPPEKARLGEYRHIEIRTNRRGVSIRARPGYTMAPLP
jgi:VWFA-related protein